MAEAMQRRAERASHRMEFTGFLIDSGHAAVLRAGDAIALPNHGLDRTAMHSVYCGSDGPNVGFSLGLRTA